MSNYNLRTLVLILLISGLGVKSLSAQIYHKDDKEGLRQLLGVSSKENINSVKYDIPGYNEDIDWENSEGWIENIAGITWSDASPKRIVDINFYGKNWSGTMDCSNFKELESLTIAKTMASKIDTRKNKKLKYLNCSETRITDLDISKNKNLEQLVCYEMYKLQSTLDLRNNKKLKVVSCKRSGIKQLDVSKCKELIILNCSYNELETLTVNSKKLKDLNCDTNKLTELKIKNGKSITNLDCSSNELVSLDVSRCESLKEFKPYRNKLTSLDITKCTKLEWLDCHYNQIAELDVSKCTDLSTLLCFEIGLRKLNLLGNHKLKSVNCDRNPLTELLAKTEKSLEYLNCVHSKLRYSTLPQIEIATYLYGGQDRIDGEPIKDGDIIDLSSEHIIAGYTTQYQWKDNRKQITMEDMGDGKFKVINASEINGALWCIMINEAFPRLELQYRTEVIK